MVHVITRLVDGRFIIDDAARDRYLALLRRALRRSGWSLVSYAIMSSHIHLALVVGETRFEDLIKSVHIRFAQWLNRRASASNPSVLGHVIADRPTTKLIPADATRFLVAYHHANPIKAGVVTDPRHSSWTSHRAYVGLSPPRGGLDLELGRRLCGIPDSQEGRTAFHQFVCGRTSFDDQSCPPVAARVAKPLPAEPPPRLHTSLEVVRAAARAVGLPFDRLGSGRRTRRETSVRRVALIVGAHLGFPAREMASRLGISEAAASLLLSRSYDRVEVLQAAQTALHSLGLGDDELREVKLLT